MTADILPFRKAIAADGDDPGLVVPVKAPEPTLGCHCLGTSFELGLNTMTLRCARCGCEMPLKVTWEEKR